MPATDLERLVVQLSADIKRYENAMAKARGITEREFNRIQRSANSLDKRLSSIGGQAGRSLAAPLAGITAALGTREVLAYADAWTVANNKLAAASQISGRQARELQDVLTIADETRTSISATTDLYSKLLRATKDVAASEEDVAKATATVNQAFKAGGAATSEQIAGILQLSQALGSGLLQGDELRSIREAAPLLAQAIADEFGTTIGGLKELGAQGELTAARIFSAILKGQPQIRAAFLVTNRTIADSFTLIENQFIRYIGQTDDSLGATERLVSGLQLLADNFDAVADTAIAFASILAAGLLGRSIGKMVAQLGLAGAALATLVGQMRAAQGAARAGIFFGGLGGVAGPVGAAIGVAAAAALYFATSSDEASRSGARYEAVLRGIEEAAKGSAEEIKNTANAISERRENELAQDLDLAKKKADEARIAVVELFDHLIRSVDRTNLKEGTIEEFEALRDKIAQGTGTADEVREALFRLANQDYKFQAVADSFQPILDALENAIKALGVFTDMSEKLGKIELGDERGQIDRSGEQFKKFIDERDRVASSTEERQRLDAKTKEVMEASEKAGQAMTEAAARIQAASEIAAENLTKSTERNEEAVRSSLIDIAKQFSGFNENRPKDRAALTDFFRAANVNVDPKMTAWCAAFVNAVLATGGLPGTGALNARSFLDYGTATQDPKVGDLVVLKRGSGNIQGHVGFFMGDAGGGGIRVLGGNQGDEVSEKTFSRADVLGFRQIPGADVSESLAREVELRKEDIEVRKAHADIVSQTMTAIQMQNEQLGLETSLMSASNAERERRMLIFETLNQLTAQGIDITDDLRAQVEAEAAARYNQVAAYDAAALAAERLKERQEELKQVQEEISGAFQSALKGLITDLIHGKDATEALYDAVSRLADRLLDIALDIIFKNLFGNILGGVGGGGGLLAGILHTGGKVGGAVSSRRVNPAVFAGAHRYHSGGLVGDEVPIIAKRGELVLPKAQARNVVNNANNSPSVVDARTTVINRFDAAGVLSEALSQPEGVKVVLNVIKSQPGAFRQAING